jgi:uncharacterized protein with GYD domain
MPSYMMLVKFTDQGIRNIKESPNRLDAFKKTLRGSGAELRDYFMVMGQYDAMVILTAPNDEVVTKLALAACALGNVRTETHRVYTEDEMRKLIGGLT